MERGRGKGNILLVGIVSGAVGGLLVGMFLPSVGISVEILGELFLRALKMLIVPLVMASMIAGVGRIGNVRALGRLGSYTLLFYLATTFASVLVGLILVTSIRPGEVGMPSPDAIDQAVVEQARQKEMSPGEAITSLLTKMVSPNIVQSMVEMDILPLIIFSIIFGAILISIGESGRRVLEVVEGINETILKFVLLIMWTAPVGIFALVSSRFGHAVVEGNFEAEMLRLLRYALTVIIGLAFHAFITLPLLLLLLGKRNPYAMMLKVATPLFTAMSTASSSATLPITLQTLEKRAEVSPRVSRFVATLGATINMDGTALYEAVAAVFIAQSFGIELSFLALVIVFLTATLAAIGAAGIPEAGLVTMVMVLTAVGLPVEGIGIIISIDWFLDRLRTTTNVWGDCVGSALLDHQLVFKPETSVSRFPE